MHTEHYTRRITVNTTASQAYQALTDGYSLWWTPCEHSFSHIGDRITFRFPPQASYWTFEATALVPSQYVELLCVEANHILLDKPASSKTEWLGTSLRFNIETVGDQTQVELIHSGLTPDKDCYEICEAGWDHFFLNSLSKYLNTGVGEPHHSI